MDKSDNTAEKQAEKSPEVTAERSGEKPSDKLPDKQVEKSDKSAEKQAETTTVPKPPEKPPAPAKAAEETVEIPELDFQSPKPKPGSKKVKPKVEKVAVGVSNIFFMDDDDFCFGNPLDGLSIPAPPDVRAILRKRIPEILAEYQKTDSPQQVTGKPTSPKETIQFETVHEHGIGSDYPSGKIFRSSKKKK